MPATSDIIVIGAGIAGVSAAALLAARHSVVLLEAESAPGYHATGRSAAYFEPAYGNPVVRSMTALSEPFYRSPPSGFAASDLLLPRDCLFVARRDQTSALATMRAENPSLEQLDAREVLRLMPLLAADYVAEGLLDKRGGDLDVDAILQGYLRLLRQRDGIVKTNSAVNSLRYTGSCWRCELAQGVFEAPVVVNAAGAWADEIAVLAGLGSLGLAPLRRTAVSIALPGNANPRAWPMLVDADEDFYCKPDGGRLLISAADETPSAPCDAQADELDVAIAIDRFSRACGIAVPGIIHRWAGLRTFAPDRSFVVGFDPRAQGFFWLAGQGGYGVQTAPAIAELCDTLISDPVGGSNRATLMALAAQVSPQRLLATARAEGDSQGQQAT